jgi:RNA recognition motif-containing protein
VIFVKNLNFETTEEKLRFAFEQAKVGKVSSVKIVKTKEEQRSKGYGFI